jgi:hypothetical protein
MLCSLPRRLARLAFVLGLLSMLPLCGIVKAQPPPSRTGFLPYFVPGSWEPLPRGHLTTALAARNANEASARNPLPQTLRLPAIRIPDPEAHFNGFGSFNSSPTVTPNTPGSFPPAVNGGAGFGGGGF